METEREVLARAELPWSDQLPVTGRGVLDA